MSKKKKSGRNESRIKESDNLLEGGPSKRIIYGAFIIANRIVQNQLSHEFSIKLSAITMIYNLPDEEGSIFYTYKDCSYFTALSETDLRKAINSFIFEPETHWETYPNEEWEPYLV